MPPSHQIMQHKTVPSSQVMTSSGAQRNHPVLPTLTVPSTTPYASSANKRKRENHQNNRRALYEELQELVLRKVHVRVRPEGQVHPFYDKIMLRLDPSLKENERCRYLVERLVPRPQNLQGNTQTIATKGGASPPKQEKPAMEVVTQDVMKTSSHAQTLLKEVGQTKTQEATPPQENEQEIKEASHGVQGNDVHMEDSTNDVNAIGDDVAMCSTLSTLSEQGDGGCHRK
jgi:hypothetical protein